MLKTNLAQPADLHRTEAALQSVQHAIVIVLSTETRLHRKNAATTDRILAVE